MSRKHSYDQSFMDQSLYNSLLRGDNALENSGEVTPPSMMLITGFGMRNADSLQRALLKQQQYKQMLLNKYKKDIEPIECASLGEDASSFSEDSTQVTNSMTTMPVPKSFSLEYLMGLAAPAEEQALSEKGPKAEQAAKEDSEKPDSLTGRTKAMRQAQRYLRHHRIFEFFKFLTAHLLSQLPENPIEFLLDLLDKCLMYRSGIGSPPLLFEKPHLEQLFYLMDRMKTGFIEMAQYKTGMETLGITFYEQRPPLSTDGLVMKETFVEEAYDSLTDMFIEMIRRRGHEPPAIVPPPPSAASTWSA